MRKNDEGDGKGWKSSQTVGKSECEWGRDGRTVEWKHAITVWGMLSKAVKEVQSKSPIQGGACLLQNSVIACKQPLGVLPLSKHVAVFQSTAVGASGQFCSFSWPPQLNQCSSYHFCITTYTKILQLKTPFYYIYSVKEKTKWRP